MFSLQSNINEFSLATFAVRKNNKLNLLANEKRLKLIKEELMQNSLISKDNLKKIDKIHLGYPDPPEIVNAVGKDSAAIVWWQCEKPINDTIVWEIHKYRKDKNAVVKGAWKYKGFVSIESSILQEKQYTMNSLANDYQYRFSIKCINKLGISCESVFSNEVMVESPLPVGWFRFYDDKFDRFYYSTIKSQRTCWERPEKYYEPYFIEERILLKFKQYEIDNLKELYFEDIQHFGAINKERFGDLLREIGEQLLSFQINQLFKVYVHSIKGTSILQITKFSQFLNIIYHIKIGKMAKIVSSLPSVLVNDVMSYFKTLPTYENWNVVRTCYTNIFHYKHKETNAVSLEMPNEIRFYLPNELLRQLLKVFDLGHLDNFRLYFLILNENCTGFLSKDEFRKLLKMIHINIHDGLFRELFNRIKRNNNNNNIDFAGFCTLMLMIAEKDALWVAAASSTDEVRAGVPRNKAAGRKLSLLGGAVSRLLRTSFPGSSGHKVLHGPVPVTCGGLSDQREQLGTSRSNESSSKSLQSFASKDSKKSMGQLFAFQATKKLPVISESDNNVPGYSSIVERRSSIFDLGAIGKKIMSFDVISSNDVDESESGVSPASEMSDRDEDLLQSSKPHVRRGNILTQAHLGRSGVSQFFHKMVAVKETVRLAVPEMLQSGTRGGCDKYCMCGCRRLP